MKNIDWSFIGAREGNELTGYVPKNKNNTIDENSGVTIGAGFDLGQQTEETIKNFNFQDLSILDSIKPYLGLKGAKAAEVANNLKLPEDKIVDLNTAVNNTYADDIEKTYNKYTKLKKFDEIDPALQTIITSVGFHYGDLRKTPRFFNAALNNDIEGVVDELRNFKDEYPDRRNLEADYLVERIKNIATKKKLESVNSIFVQQDLDGELYMDRVFKTFQNQPAETPSLWQGTKAAIELNMAIPILYRTLINQSFKPDPNGFTWKDNEQEILKILRENNISSNYYSYFVDNVSRDHFYHLVERVKLEQENRNTLQQMGGTGLFLDIGAYVLDPINLLGVGYIHKALVAKQALTASRLERFKEAGLVYGTYEGLLTGLQANESPTVGAIDVMVAASLGGSLGGAVSIIGRGQLSRFAKDIEHLEIKDTGIKTTKKGDEFFKETEVSTIKAQDHFDVNDLFDPVDVVDKSIIYPNLRDYPVAKLFSLTKSGSLGGSLSDLARSFAYRFFEEPIGYVFKGEGRTSARIASQEETVELIRDKYLNIAMNQVAREVRLILQDYLKDEGLNVWGRLTNLNARSDFMQKVTRAIRTFDPNNKNLYDTELLKNVHINKAANLYADAFERWGKTLKEKGIEGADFSINRGYIPRRLSLERWSVLESKIGEAGIIDLLTRAILSTQKYLDIPKDAELVAGLGIKELKFKTPNFNKINQVNEAEKIGRINKLQNDLEIANLSTKSKLKEVAKAAKDEVKKIKEQIKKLKEEVNQSKIKLEKDFISPDKANLMATAINNYIKNSRRVGGFDLEALLRVKDTAKLKIFFKESFPHLKDNEIDKMATSLGSVLETVTSGRLIERIRLNESFETTIKGQKVRLDELYENDVSLLYNEYSQEFAGWAAMAERVGIKSRDEWNAYSNGVRNDIDKKYEQKIAKEKSSISKWLLGRRREDELATLDSVFQNLMGRSSEVQNTWTKAAANIRRYNFIRILSQVGVASLPEIGNIISATGIRAFVQNIPEFKDALSSLKTGVGINDSLFRELRFIGFDTGADHLRRLTHATEQADIGTAAHTIQSSGRTGNFLTNAEKLTSWTSGLTIVDTVLRRIATRAFVDKFADDLIKLKTNNFDFSSVNLNRYKVLGFSEDELKKFANEFSNGAVTKESTMWGTKVKEFNFANWQDQSLLSKFANKLNRHVKRTVQYNFIGDTSQIFSDNSFGKMLGQFRQFSIVAWNKQLLHNIAMSDYRTFANFSTTLFFGGLAFMGQTHFNSIGMGEAEKRKYLEKRLGAEGDYTKLGLAAFQRTGWSSITPWYLDIVTSALAPDYRFNTRTSGLEINLLHGNPTVNLGKDSFNTVMSFLKATKKDYEFSKVDMRRLVHLFGFSNSFGISNMLNYMIDRSPLPDEGQRKQY